MVSNPMQRKVRNSFLLGVLVMLIVAILIGAIIFLVAVKPNKDKEEEGITLEVYRLKTGINVKSGQEITSDMVESVEIFARDNTTDFIPAKIDDGNGNGIDVSFDSGYKSKLVLSGGTILTYSMLYSEDETPDSLRYVEYNMITIPTTVDIGSYVDIRLRLPNSQDLIVISKKEIINLYNQTVGLNLTEEEILILNSAIVESYVMTSSELYMAEYVEPGLQEAATYTYSPSEGTVTLIKANPNIVDEMKNEIANNYYNSSDIRNPIVDELQKNSVEANENIKQGMQEQIEAAKKAREDYLSELNGY